MGKMLSLFGQRFGKLIAVEPQGSNGGKKILWLCKCDCGSMAIIAGTSLKSGTTKSCGCLVLEQARKMGLSNKTHGYSSQGKISKIYHIWNSMIRRCTNPKHKYYSDYGGRGIKVCDRWLKFENFLEDMGEAPPGLTLDRIKNKKGYYKENCRWATWRQQQRNRRDNRPITHNGKTQLLIEWAEETGIDRKTIAARIDRYGWSTERALTTPVQTTRLKEKSQ